MKRSPSALISAWIGRLAGEVDKPLVERALGALRDENLTEASRCLDKSNAATRRGIWLLAVKDETVSDETVITMIMDHGARQRLDIKRFLLDVSLERGWLPTASHLIRHDAPLGPVPQSQGSERDNGPLARLAYDEYLAIPEDRRAELARMMMEKGPLTHFNPGMIARHDVLCVFLELAPAPNDKAAWEGFVWGPRDVAYDQVRFATDPRNVPELLSRGYPGIPINLVVRALGAGQQDHALAVLQWAGDELPTKGCAGLVSAYDTVTEEPVLAAGFWHAVADLWASGVVACKSNGSPSDMKNTWPREDVLDLLLRFKELDPCSLDEEGRLPTDLAVELCGEPGPMAEVESRRQAMALTLSTPAASTHTSSRHRL